MLKRLLKLLNGDKPKIHSNHHISSGVNVPESIDVAFILSRNAYIPPIYESEGSLFDQVAYHVDSVNQLNENHRNSGIQYSLETDTYPMRLEIINGQLMEVPDDGTAPTFSNEVKRIMDERNLSATELCSRILMVRKRGFRNYFLH